VMARLDRLERRLTISGGDPSPAPTVATEPASVKPAPHIVEPTVIEPVRPAPPQPEPATQPASAPEPEVLAPEPEPDVTPAPTTTAAGSTLTLVDVRRLWPDIVEATKQRRRITWIYLTQQAKVVDVDDATLTLGFANAGARDSFDNGGSAEIVRQAAIDVVGHDWKVDTIVDPNAAPAAAPPPSSRPVSEPAAPPPAPEPVTEAPEWAVPAEVDDPAPESGEHPSASARQAIAAARSADQTDQPAQPAEPDDGARADDTDMESSGLDGAQLLVDALGAQVIEEIPHQ
jgi:DNA polymerase-3 subunit gamma/tau